MAELAMNPGWLPWDRTTSEERLFLKALAIALGVSLLLGVIVPLVPVPEPKREEAEAVPPRLARMLLERKPPAPVKARAEQKSDEQPKEQKSDRPLTEQERRTAAARDKAASSGVLTMSNQLAALSSVGVLSKATSRVAVSSGGSQWVQQEATMVSNATQGSGGIDTTTLVREKVAVKEEEHATTTVVQEATPREASSSLLVAKDELANVTRAKKVAKRNPDAISETLDRNKGAVYAIYNRALRQNAMLAGNVLFAITIEASGKVSACKVVSSELHDEELERKLAARIAMIDFGAEAVPAVTVKWPLNFLPN